MRVGVDSYAYHRLLGEVRAGETAPPAVFPRGSLDVVAEARALGADFVLLQTSFLGNPDAFNAAPYAAEADGLPVGLAWGAPDGLAFGDRPRALDDLIRWLPPASELGLPVMRVVAGGPRHRGRAPADVVAPLREACAAAREAGLRLALENHGDLTAAQLEELLEQVDGLGVCFDTANALRVGDDVGAAAARLGPAVALLHLKDCLGSWDDPVSGPVSAPLGEGVVPLVEVLAACPGALVCIELGQLAPDADERALVAGGVDWVRDR